MSRLIPFKFLPASWGLKGTSRDIAQAEYELTGYELEKRLAEIKLSGKDLKEKLLVLDLGAGKLSDYEYDIECAKLDYTGDELLGALIDIDYEHDKITEKQHDYKIAELRNDPLCLLEVQLKHKDISVDKYEKEYATIKGEPWVSKIRIIPDPMNPAAGTFELDWNQHMIDYLMEAGFVAPTPEAVIDLWITAWAKNIALEELAGTGYFDEQADMAMQLKRKRLGGGKVEIS